MTGQTVATAHWRALDRDGEDKCRLAMMDHGWMLVGHARFRDATGWAALDYVVRCDEGWHTLSCDVSGTQGGGAVALRLERNGADWTLNDTPQPDLRGATDVDLGFTPATNLMPIRRLPEVGTIRTCAAWLRVPGPLLDPLHQSYRRERGGYVHYAAEETGFAAYLEVDEHGFVTGYPGLWEAVP
ncbi:putative glycolipid-binding domain-containing protein [Thetidibacter halocola]|uniref:Putative glycolipid-binding domain-containing protein n=1 Tax=Thetidibacter halocola TaxID=2827239 RepID=A0A8J7WDN4_9RHOB|nr:putative glycolipid-binding domain-containing protein [Thetidibacter halocola]MBS0123431.1 putative glycolipid-binding domain-containing protein [Thetidibacter halocola]